jgi:DNA-binding MarR family transcriptional regulator
MRDPQQRSAIRVDKTPAGAYLSEHGTVNDVENQKLANDSWESLLRVHALFMKQFLAEPMWNNGISLSEYDVLYTLSKLDHAPSLAELNRGVLLSQPAISRMIDRLVDRGLVTRVMDPKDRRQIRISLTQAGAAEQKRLGRMHAASVAELMSPLSPEEQAELIELCRKLSQ